MHKHNNFWLKSIQRCKLDSIFLKCKNFSNSYSVTGIHTCSTSGDRKHCVWLLVFSDAADVTSFGLQYLTIVMEYFEFFVVFCFLVFMNDINRHLNGVLFSLLLFYLSHAPGVKNKCKKSRMTMLYSVFRCVLCQGTCTRNHGMTDELNKFACYLRTFT